MAGTCHFVEWVWILPPAKNPLLVCSAMLLRSVSRHLKRVVVLPGAPSSDKTGESRLERGRVVKKVSQRKCFKRVVVFWATYGRHYSLFVETSTSGWWISVAINFFCQRNRITARISTRDHLEATCGRTVDGGWLKLCTVANRMYWKYSTLLISL